MRSRPTTTVTTAIWRRPPTPAIIIVVDWRLWIIWTVNGGFLTRSTRQFHARETAVRHVIIRDVLVTCGVPVAFIFLLAEGDLAEALARSYDAEQRQEEQRAEAPADGHHEHEERAEVLVGDEQAERDGRAGGEGRYSGHGDGRADRAKHVVHARLAVLRRRHLVADAVVDAEVDRQADGEADDDRVEERHLPAEQHERCHGDGDREADGEHGVERDEDVERREEQHEKADADGQHYAEQRATTEGVLQVVQTQLQPAQSHYPAVVQSVGVDRQSVTYVLVHLLVECVHVRILIRPVLVCLYRVPEGYGRSRAIVDCLADHCLVCIHHKRLNAVVFQTIFCIQGSHREHAFLTATVSFARFIDAASNYIEEALVIRRVVYEGLIKKIRTEFPQERLRVRMVQVEVAVEPERARVVGVELVAVVGAVDAPHDLHVHPAALPSELLQLEAE